MIYKLEEQYLIESADLGMRFICSSTEGEHLLVQANRCSLPYVEQYSEDQEYELQSLPLWQQPGEE